MATAEAPRVRGIGDWAYHGSAFVRSTEAQVPLTTQALHYGTGVFEGLRAYTTGNDGEVRLFRALDHYERLIASCRILGIEVGHSAPALVEISAELLRRNGFAVDSYLRPLAYKLALIPGQPFGVSLRGVSDAFSVSTFLMPVLGPVLRRCVISTWRRPESSVIPVRAKITGAYVNSALAVDEARATGHDDVILLNSRGLVAESSTSNVFAVRGRRLLTPPLSADILEGITRDTIMKLGIELGYEPIEQDLTRSDLVLADEVFLTATGLGIAPVAEISGRTIGSGGIGPITAELARRYDDVVRKGHERYPEWSHLVRLG